MLPIENKSYTPALRWKKGEMEALDSLDDVSKERILPHIVFPPTTVRDIENKRVLSRDEFSLVQVGRLQKYWSGRPCLLDLRFLRFDPDDSGSDAARVSDFLLKARSFGCKVIPVIDADVDTYRASAMSAYILNSSTGGAIRIGLNDLQNDGLEEMLNTLLSSMRIPAPECILIVDLADAAIANVASFVRFTTEWLARLHHFGAWKRIIVEASNYPTTNPAPHNGKFIVSRNEWLSWEQVVKADRDILGWAQFGDFGADHGQIDFSGGGRTIIHMRYATANGWIVERGGKPIDTHDGTIWTVAKRIVGSGQFVGERFSAGDEFVSLCSSKEGGPGNATTWRWANMVHHMTLATIGVGELIGAPFKPPERAPVGRQFSLLESAK